jgi:hypothetical protein
LRFPLSKTALDRHLPRKNILGTRVARGFLSAPFIYRGDRLESFAMKNDTQRLDTTVWDAVKRDGTLAESPLFSGFVVFPMPWPTGNVYQTLVDAQHALYQLASQQAAVAVQAIRSRRQRTSARGVYLWN